MIEPALLSALRTTAEARPEDEVPPDFPGGVPVIALARAVVELDEAVDRLVERLEFLERPEEMT